MKTETRKKYAEEFVEFIKECKGADNCLQIIAYSLIDKIAQLENETASDSRARCESFVEWILKNKYTKGQVTKTWMREGVNEQTALSTSELFDEFIKDTAK